MTKKKVILIIVAVILILIGVLCFIQCFYLDHLNEVTQLNQLGIYDENKWILTIRQHYEYYGCALSGALGLAIPLAFIGTWAQSDNTK